MDSSVNGSPTPPHGPPHDICQQLVPSQLDTILNTVLFVIIFLTHIPQLTRIIRRRSTAGISPYTIILSYTFNLFLASKELYYSSFSTAAIECCRPNGLYGPHAPGSDGTDQHLRGFEAWGVLLGLCQVGLLLLGSLIQIVLWLCFPPRFGTITGSTLSRTVQIYIDFSTPFILLFAGLYIKSALGTALTPKSRDNGMCCRDLSEVLSWVVTMAFVFVFGVVQYIPQFHYTQTSKENGSLSVWGLVCQAPTLVALGVSLGLRALRTEKVVQVIPNYGWPRDLNFEIGAFGPWMTALAQFVLLFVLWLVRRNRRGEIVPVESENNEVHEQTPLIREV